MEAEVEAIWNARAREAQQNTEERHRDPTVTAHERAAQRDKIAEGMPGAVEGN